MHDPRFAQRLFTLLSVDASAGMPAAKSTYDAHRAEGGSEEPLFEALVQATPGTATFVKLQRALMADLRVRMR